MKGGCLRNDDRLCCVSDMSMLLLHCICHGHDAQHCHSYSDRILFISGIPYYDTCTVIMYQIHVLFIVIQYLRSGMKRLCLQSVDIILSLCYVSFLLNCNMVQYGVQWKYKFL